MENKVVIDGRVQSELKEENGIYSFNFSAPTGFDYNLKGEQKFLYTYIRVVYVGENPEKLKKELKVKKDVRLYGKLDSEKYITQNEKVVYNKVLVVDKIYELLYDEERDIYEEFVKLC